MSEWETVFIVILDGRVHIALKKLEDSYYVDIRYYVAEQPTRLGVCLTQNECNVLIDQCQSRPDPNNYIHLEFGRNITIYKREKSVYLRNLSKQELMNVLLTVVNIIDYFTENPESNFERRAIQLYYNLVSLVYKKDEKKPNDTSNVLAKKDKIIKTLKEYCNSFANVKPSEIETSDFGKLSINTIISGRLYDEYWIDFLQLFVPLYEQICC